MLLKRQHLLRRQAARFIRQQPAFGRHFCGKAWGDRAIAKWNLRTGFEPHGRRMMKRHKYRAPGARASARFIVRIENAFR
jgi:hypothetical protein